jgi:hypothetical protein
MKVSGLTREEFLMMNPDVESLVKSDALIPTGFTLHVPQQARLGIERGLMIASRLNGSND